MASELEPFSAPYNWCDRNCERCPVAGECKVYLRDRQRRWAHEARGIDPDDIEVVMADVTADLTLSIQLLQEAAEKEGIDLSEPLPARPVGLAAERLRRTSLHLVSCLAKLQTTQHVDDDDAAELVSSSSLFAVKIARVAGYIEDGGRENEIWACDATPNLILLERLRSRFGAALAKLPADARNDEGVTKTLAELDRLLAPLFADIDPALRAELARLEASGRAPSPFLGDRPPALEPGP